VDILLRHGVGTAFDIWFLEFVVDPVVVVLDVRWVLGIVVL